MCSALPLATKLLLSVSTTDRNKFSLYPACFYFFLMILFQLDQRKLLDEVNTMNIQGQMIFIGI